MHRAAHLASLRAFTRLPRAIQLAVIRAVYGRHPVGAIAVILDAEGRVLLVRQSYRRGPAWSVPGGWVARGEDPARGAEREVAEELGLAVTAGPVAVTGRGWYGELRMAFLCDSQAPPVPRPNIEIAEARFFPLDALPPMEAGLRDLIERTITPKPSLP